MSFTDFIRLQNDWAHVLLSDERLAKVNVATRDQIIESGSKLPDETIAAETLVYTAERNGFRGAGVIVERPTLLPRTPNVPGPQGDIVLEFLILEDPEENLAPMTGTGLGADQIGQTILDIGHIFTSQGDGVYRAESLRPARDWEPLRGYRAMLRIEQNRGQTDRVAYPQFSIAGAVTILSPTGGAAIYFTTNGSCPAPSNKNATIYSAPLTLGAGTVLRAAAFKSGMIQSAIAMIKL